MDFLSGLCTVDFKVWISYLDVHFDYPNAVARLTVDRAGAYGTPTCVFQINNSEGFLVGPPNIDINKSRSFLSWLCSTHACWCALAPANLPMKELVCIASILGTAILVRIAIKMLQCGLLVLIMHIFGAVVLCSLFGLHTKVLLPICVFLHRLIVLAIYRFTISVSGVCTRIASTFTVLRSCIEMIWQVNSF